MTQGSDTKFENRSWTAEPSKSSNRVSVVAFLALSLLLLIGAYLYLLWGNSAERTFAVSFAVSDYDERIPQPMFGVWDLSTFESTATENGLKPWTTLSSQTYQDLQNSPDIEAALNELPLRLEKIGLERKDTLVVQLRCHAVVALDAEGEWNCGLFVGESSGSKSTVDDTVYPFAKILKRLKNVPAKNIVLIADICDLKSVPYRGWLVNPIATYLLNSCEKLARDENANGNDLWIICAAADAQPTYFSTKRKKTLFEAACENSLQQIPRQSFLSLADYFEATARYCYAASAGTQTPLMIHANKHAFCSPNSDVSWQLARRVSLCRNEGKPKIASNQEKVKAPKDTKKVNVSSNPNSTSMQFISFHQTPTSKAGNPTQDDTQATGIAKFDEDDELRFWRLRDFVTREQNSNEKWRWSPADFAPFLWRKMQREAASDSRKAERFAQELNIFQRVQAMGVPASGETTPLLQAWNDFLESNKNQKLWKNESFLNDSERDEWVRIRQEYRSYIECVSELVAWRDLAAEFPLELQADFDKMLDSLEQARHFLPENPSEYALKKSSELRLTDTASSVRRKMKQSLSAILVGLRVAVKLSWVNERSFQVLLASPIPNYEQRKQLTEQFLSREIKDIKVTVSENDDNLEKLLNPTNIASSTGQNFCKTLRRSTAFFLETLAPPPSSELKGMLEWGQVYIREIQMAASRLKNDRSLQQWHYLSLIEFGFVDLPAIDKAYSGIVVSPTKAKAIRLVARPDFPALNFPRMGSNASLSIEVKFADETDVSACQLQWSVLSPSNDLLTGFQIAIGDKPLKRGTKAVIQPQAKEVRFNSTLSPDQFVPNGTVLQLIAFDADGNTSNTLRIPVFRNAERIELSVAQVDRGSQKKLVSRASDVLDLESYPQFDFEGPAIVGPSSRFAFSLGNKQLFERKARLKIYAIPNYQLASQIGEKRISDTFLVTDSSPVVLPAYGDRSEDVPIKLRAASNLANPKMVNEFIVDSDDTILIFEIDELEAIGDALTIRGRSERYVGRLKPMSPGSSEMLSVAPSPIELDQALKMRLETTQELWQKYDLRELQVDIFCEGTDHRSKIPQTFRPSPGKLKLTQDKLVDTFVGDVMDKDKSFQFELEIGRYPRAITYIAKPNSLTLERVFPTKVEITKIKPWSKQAGKEIEPKMAGQRWVCPNKIEGIAISYDEIHVLAKADFGLDQTASLLFSKIEGGAANFLNEQKIDHDRTVVASLSTTAEDGVLSIAFSPGELQLVQTRGIDRSLNGVYSLQLKCGDSIAKAELIFDLVAPLPSKLEVEGRPELFLGGKLPIWIEPEDGASGSGIETVLFAVSKENEGINTEYKPNQISKSLDMTVWDIDRKRCRVFLDSKLLEGTPSGVITIVARTVDRAGNFQDKNTPILVRWTDNKSPTEKD